MAQDAGEFFVKLGIQGADKTIGALGDVKGGMSSVKDMSLETKAAIVAVIYGLEQMMSSSLHLGTSLVNSANMLGISEDKLYKYGTAARLAGGNIEDVIGSLSKLQSIQANISAGQGGPGGIKYINDALARAGLPQITEADWKNENILGVFDKIQKFVSLPNVPTALKRKATTELVSETTLKDMLRGAFEGQALSKINAPSAKEFKQVDIARKTLEESKIMIDRAFLDFTAKYGKEFATDIKKLIPPMIKLATAAEKIADLLIKSGFIDKGVNVLTTTARGGEVIHAIEGGSKVPLSENIKYLGIAISNMTGIGKLFTPSKEDWEKWSVPSQSNTTTTTNQNNTFNTAIHGANLNNPNDIKKEVHKGLQQHVNKAHQHFKIAKERKIN